MLLLLLVKYVIFIAVMVLQFTNRSVDQDFPGGAVVKNPPASAGDTGLIPGLERSHMLWSN